ncbi:hypothetical protein CYV19_18565 [Natronobacterium gregoryi SP2]|uniref:Uncharacterized protein n=3 Tax=Natronobacterium gregoryi TaxID=44930 RepID=A0A2J4JA09_NATGS|nr:hypothetical protein CYV19_18565 [Natronobacterium gregoryi SP2]
MKSIFSLMLKSKALLVVDVRQLALIYEEMSELAENEEVHRSRRASAAKLRDECATLLGRDE